MQTYVKVLNKNDFPIKDHFDGVEYVFMPGKKTTIPFYIASHFLGIQTPEEIHDMGKISKFISKRWGWNRAEIGMSREAELCNNIVLDVAHFEMREIEHHAEDTLPVPNKDSDITGDEDEDSEEESHSPKRGRPFGKKGAAA